MKEYPGTLGILFLELKLDEVHSLKGKRGVLKPLISKLQKQFNASVSELDYQDKWQHSLIGIAMIGSARGVVEQRLWDIEDWVQNTIPGEVLSTKVNIL